MIQTQRPGSVRSRRERGFLLVAAVLGLIGAAGLSGGARAEEALYAVAGSPTTGIAVGERRILFSSTDHHAWFRSTEFDSTLTYLSAVQAGSGFVVGAADGSIWRSSDPGGRGITFVSAGQVGTGAIRGLATIGAWIVAVGDNGQVFRSADLTGSSWTDQNSPTSTTLRAVASNGLCVVAVGENGVLLRGGIQGTAWERVTSIGETRTFLGVLAQPSGLYLAFGAGGVFWRGEPDGRTWTALASPTSSALRGGAAVGLTTILVGDAGLVYYSPGGFTGWQPADSQVSVTLRAVNFTGSDVVAVGDRYTVLWSRIGLTWNPSLVPVEQMRWGRIKARFSPQVPGE